MKKKIFSALILALFPIYGIWAQDVTTVEATDSDISDNLDLEAVASVFGEAKDLEDFEKKLNDPDTQISNLDLNEDGEVDYLRVVEASKDDTHVVTIQAVIAKDQYQDVATIDVEKDSNGDTQVQVVGDVYMYGPDYIIEPVYVHPPVIWVWFWGPYYHPWHSPYYWGYYPPYYHPWRPYPPHRYRTNVHVHINVNHTYRHTTVRRSKTSIHLQNKNSRNDYGMKHPDKSFAKRNEGIKNKQELNKQKTKPTNTKQVNSKDKISTGKKVQSDWKPQSERDGGKSNVKNNKVSVPTQKPGNKTTKTPSTKPTQKTNKVNNNINKPNTTPQAKPNVPVNKPQAKPQAAPKVNPKKR
ncbi:hypothetical protein E9993_02795 [Labilibacter sediminis]|nr:hypothetical protein E9993_02795 [Labilibacter sediminis]